MNKTKTNKERLKAGVADCIIPYNTYLDIIALHEDLITKIDPMTLISYRLYFDYNNCEQTDRQA